MKYIIGLIVIIGLAVGTYFWVQPRPDCSATITTTNECLEGVTLGETTLEVKPSDYQAPNYNPQKTENGANLWK